MKIRNKIIIAFFILFLVISSTVYSGDTLYHFMQAHQDYLVIAKVIDIKGKNIFELEISEFIDESSIRKDIPKKIEAEILIDTETNKLKKGDNIAVSLSKRGGGYKLENGFYKITTNDTDTLEVVIENESYINSELAAVELFLKSRGKIKDFYFVQDKSYVHKNSGIIGTDDICIYTKENGKVLPTDFEKNEKHVIEKKKINVKLILLAIFIFISAQVITVFVYLKLNPDSKLTNLFKLKEDKQEGDKN